VEQKLRFMAFSPALQKGVPIASNITLKLTIVKDNKAPHLKDIAAADSLKLINKEVLSSWINRQRQVENLQRIFSSEVDASNRFAPQLKEAQYRTNFYQAGLNYRPYIVSKDGFIQLNSMYYNSLSFQMLSNFRRFTLDGSVLSFANEQYTLPAMCTDVYAGLGDYEYNFARVQVLKNHLLGIKDFYSEFGFIVQNGFWQNVISDQTSNRMFFSIPINQSKISLNWENYEHNIPSTSLLPGLQNGTTYSIGHELRDIYVKWDLPWVSLGWKTYKESFKNSTYLNSQNYHQQQLLLLTKKETTPADVVLQYQYGFDNNIPITQTLYQNNSSPEHQLLTTISKQFSNFDYTTQLLLFKSSLKHGLVNFGYTGAKGRVGALFNTYHQNHVTKAYSDFYNDGIDRYFPSAYMKQAIALQYKTPSTIDDFSIDITGGIKQISIKEPPVFVVNTSEHTYDLPYSEVLLQYQKSIGKYSAVFEQTVQWIQYHQSAYELPELQGQARLTISKDMGYENTISCGLKLTGHSDYTKANRYYEPVYGALIADVWAGVKITDLFEFQVMMQNIGSNDIFGISPHPRTVIATIHWFYLN
jgi:hypothetical protein